MTNTNAINPIITALVAGCNNINTQTGLNFTPLVVTPFVDAQLFADSPNGNAINPIINQIVGFLNQVTYKSQPNIDNLAATLGITPQQLNQSFNNPYSTNNYNTQIASTLYAPTGLIASFSYSTGLVSLSWTNNANNNTGFKIYRSTDGINYSLIHTNGNTTTYNDSPSSAATYYYKVTAYNTYGESSPSNVVNKTIAVPTIPSNLQGTVSGLEVDLSWTGSINQTGYHVYRSTDNINFSIINSPTGTTYNDTTPGAATYYYKVTAYNSYGESSMSNTINKTTVATSSAYSLFHFDTNYSNSMAYGDFYNGIGTVISTSDKKFGAGSLYIHANTDYAYGSYTIPTPSFESGTGGGFDFWIKGTNFPATAHRILSHSSNELTNGWVLDIGNTYISYKTCPSAGGHIITVNPLGSPIVNQWTHVEVSEAGDGITRVFVNGNLVGQYTGKIVQQTNSYNSYVQIGEAQSAGTIGSGYIDELRFFDVTQAHTSNFSPPTQAYT
jgi:hypothetical protein